MCKLQHTMYCMQQQSNNYTMHNSYALLLDGGHYLIPSVQTAEELHKALCLPNTHMELSLRNNPNKMHTAPRALPPEAPKIL